MKTTKLIKSILVVAFVAFLGSCSSEDGADGLNGVDGTDGVDGVDGMDGADGTDGEDGDAGTANVIYSDWIDSEFASISAAEESEQLLVSLGPGDFNADQDVILVYGRRADNAILFTVSQLPFELFSQSEVYRYRVSEGATFNALYVDNSSSDGGNKVFDYFADYRYVIIPGGVSANGKSSSIDYTKMSYEEVIAHFNIPE